MIVSENIPAALRDLRQWVLWKYESRNDKPTKIPYQPNGKFAKSDDPATWCDCGFAVMAADKYDGIGFVFAKDGGFVGIDMDGCRDPQTGQVAGWAKEIILTLDTYAEVSPSQTGVKLFVRGKSPLPTGKKQLLPHLDSFCDKTPAIEVYDFGRYFAVTGWRLKGQSEPQERPEQLAWLKQKYFADAPTAPLPDFRSETAVMERARRYLAKLPGAVSGQNGHDRTFHAACVLVQGFALSEGEAYDVLAEWNMGCQPPWSERELRHKLEDAAQAGGDRGYLRNASPERWNSIAVPGYRCPPPPPPVPTMTTLVDAAKRAIDKMRAGEDQTIELGIGDVDYAIGGGVEAGEYVILSALPSHGKTAFALQIAHNWTAQGMPVLIASEEMSDIMLGKRALLFQSDMPKGIWSQNLDRLESDLQDYAEGHAPCYIVQQCGTAAVVAERIDAAVRDHGIKAAFVDYVQLLNSPGGTRYEQVTNTSLTLNATRKRNKIVLVVLAQLRREVETRGGPLLPTNADIKDSGQMAQDADVILHLVWPWKVDNKRRPEEYLVVVGKNRNREVNSQHVNCTFMAQRQSIHDARPQDLPNYEKIFDDFNQRKDFE